MYRVNLIFEKSTPVFLKRSSDFIPKLIRIFIVGKFGIEIVYGDTHLIFFKSGLFDTIKPMLKLLKHLFTDKTWFQLN